MTIASEPISQPPRKKGFFASIANWFGNLFGSHREEPVVPPRPPVPLADVLVSEERTAEPITVPAQGGAFSFVVHPEFTWSAKGIAHATLRTRIDSYADSSVRILRNRVWPVARGFPPHRPEDAEIEINNALQEAWCFDEHGEVISCKAQVRVLADDATVDHQRPAWERLIASHARYRTELHRIEIIRDLLRRWIELIEEFGSAPLVIQSARLTDQEFAQVVRDLAAMETAMGGELVDVLDRAAATHTKIGMFEFAEAYDRAIKTYEKNAGLQPGTVSQTS